VSATCTHFCLQQTLIEIRRRNPENEKLYTRFFDITCTTKQSKKGIAKQVEMDDAKLNYGYFALMSNEI